MPLNLGTFLIVWSRSDKCRKQLLEISEKRGRFTPSLVGSVLVLESKVFLSMTQDVIKLRLISESKGR
jgi:hypothetical protein